MHPITQTFLLPKSTSRNPQPPITHSLIRQLWDLICLYGTYPDEIKLRLRKRVLLHLAGTFKVKWQTHMGKARYGRKCRAAHKAEAAGIWPGYAWRILWLRHSHSRGSLRLVNFKATRSGIWYFRISLVGKGHMTLHGHVFGLGRSRFQFSQ